MVGAGRIISAGEGEKGGGVASVDEGLGYKPQLGEGRHGFCYEVLGYKPQQAVLT